MKRLAIDPGDVHVGWAYHQPKFGMRAECGEWRPKEACRAIKDMILSGEIDEILLEEYRLYDKNYENQAWSPFKTVQLIGAIKWIAEDYGSLSHPGGTCPVHGDYVGVHVHEQGATIKTATRAQLAARGIRQLGSGTHARDAELHLWHRVLREMEAGR